MFLVTKSFENKRSPSDIFSALGVCSFQPLNRILILTNPVIFSLHFLIYGLYIYKKYMQIPQIQIENLICNEEMNSNLNQEQKHENSLSGVELARTRDTIEGG